MNAPALRFVLQVFFAAAVWCSVTAMASAEEPARRYAQEWQALTAAGQHADAAKLAETWVADANVQFGASAAETFLPMTRLASAYAANDQSGRAIGTYRQAIKIGARAIGVFSPMLIEPLVGLSNVLRANERHDDAVAALLRAKDITHRSQGIYNTQQADIVEKLSEIYLQVDDVQQAKLEQRLLYNTEARQVGHDSPDVVPALQKWAQFNVRIDRHRDARKFLYRAIEVLENAYGPDDVRIVETLELIAETFRSDVKSTLPREGARALRRVVSIYQAQEHVDQSDLLGAQVSLGDWYLATGRRALGLETHLEAIAVAREAGLSDEAINAHYARPRALTRTNRPQHNSRVGLQRYRDSWSGVSLDEIDGSVIFEFDVNERGYPRNVRVVKDTVGRARVKNILRTWVTMVVYRPKFENGQAVVTKGLRREFEF